MKQGWEIKKLGEVCNLYQPRTISGEMLVEDGKYLVYGANGIIGRYNEYNHEKSEVLLTCRGATCGTINVSEPYSWINGNAMVVQPKNDNIGKIYLQYLLQAVDWGKVITGAAQPQITRQSLSPLDVIIPPREEQERIVAELDCLSGVIEKKREQLRELDALAQSIFYQMFGDPITNEKGWEVKKLSDAVSDDCPISYGIVQPMEDVEGGIPIVRPIDLVDTFVRKDNLKRTSIDISNAYKRTILRGDEILMCVRGTTGVVSMASDELKGCNTTRGIVPLFFDSINRWFVYYLIKQQSMQCLIADNTYGIALKQINIKELRLLPIITPPLTLQQEFADKIEAIEKQKELIKQSIAQTEELFNSRMDYYFN